jgi:hypothetical protein
MDASAALPLAWPLRIGCGRLQPHCDGNGAMWQADRMADKDPGRLPLGDWRCIGGRTAGRDPDQPAYPPALAGLLASE